MNKFKFSIRLLAHIFSLFFTLTLSFSYAEGSSHVASLPPKKDVIVNPNQLMTFENQVIKALPIARKEIQSGLSIHIPHITVYLSPTKTSMRRMAEEHHHFTPPAWSGGLAYPRSLMIYLPEVSHKELLPLIKHELIHIALGQKNRLPLWVNEGVAVALGDRLNWERLWTLNEAAANGRLLRFNKLFHRFPDSGTTASIAYAQSAHFIHGLIETQGKQQFVRWINDLLNGLSIDEASENSFNKPFWQLEREWRKSLERGPIAWLSILMKSENIWSIAIFIFVIGGFKKLRRRKTLIVEAAPPPLQVRVAAVNGRQAQHRKLKPVFNLSTQEVKGETEEP